MYKNSLRNIIYPLFIAAAAAVGVLIGMHTPWNARKSAAGEQNAAFSVNNNKLLYTLSLIDRLYVDSINMDSLTEKLMPHLVEELDPHSVYIPAENYAEVNETLDGEFDGIGVVFNMATDTVIVLNVIPGGPSDKAGVKNGDRIIEIDDSLVAGRKIDQNAVVKMLRGKRGTEVKLGLQRQGIAGLVPVTVERGVIPIKSLDAAFMIAPETGYLKLSAFSKNSYEEIVKSLAQLKETGMRRLIFDLRGNSGGFLDQAILIANEFLPANKLIVYTEDKYKNQLKEYSDGQGQYVDMDLAVLIDEGSASSSEILAGALQDNDRGTVLGRRSFGKGLVQKQIPFADGSALRLTIARYYTPTGRSIQKPYSQGMDEYNLDLVNRFNHNELFSADSIHFADSLKFTTPGGKTVYGGGGIMPDVFVPLDTSDVSRYYVEVSGRNILYRYTIEYADRHRAELNAVKTVEELNALLDKDTHMLENFVAYAAAHGVKPNPVDIARSRKLMLAQLRAYIGRNTALEDVGFYANIYPVDNVVMEALRVLGEGNKKGATDGAASGSAESNQ